MEDENGKNIVLENAVKWAWRSDSAWVPFDKVKCEALERAFHSSEAKEKHVTVDKERFVDLSLSKNEIKKEYTPKSVGIFKLKA